MVLRSIRMVVGFTGGGRLGRLSAYLIASGPLNIRQYGPRAMCARERDLKIQHWALLHLHQHPASIC